jgi:GMP synthase-like glutamine amidotransferase
MIRPVLILKNEPRENPGLIELLLKKHSLDYQIVELDNKTIIESIKDYSALIVLGGPESANNTSPKMINELSLIRKAFQSHIPYLGVCLGFQALVKAMGGNVVKCRLQETGFRDPENRFFKVKLTDKGRKDRLFDQLPDDLTVFQLHGETVQITPQMDLLATGDFCKNQIIKIGENAYGIQSHFELTDELLELWIKEDADLKKLNAEQLLSDFDTLKEVYQKTGLQLFYNFLTITGLINTNS